jgi:hypothetical protein
LLNEVPRIAVEKRVLLASDLEGDERLNWRIRLHFLQDSILSAKAA